MKKLSLEDVPKVAQGKVRDIFEVEEGLLLVATDRLSAFDVVLPDEIPHKGRVLTQLSAFWFDRTAPIIQNHLISANFDDFPRRLQTCRHLLEGRSMLVVRCRPLPVECVVRGYLAGSGWKDYQRSGGICGIPLPAGLRESELLPEPIFTPSTKALEGHDRNISFDEACRILGPETAREVRRLSLDLYSSAAEYASRRGLILCDTKFEFGRCGDRLLLIDELLTPDSSRFWPAADYSPGGPQRSFDKQFVRDYLESVDWDKTPPGPRLPQEILGATSKRYLEAYRRITGRELKTS